MNKRILITAGLLLLLRVPVCRAQEVPASKIQPIGSILYLDVYEAEKMSGAKIKAYFHLARTKDSFEVTWTHIYLTPLPNIKKTGMRIERFSTADGTIRNIQRNADHTLTFDMVPDPGAAAGLTTPRKMSIWMKLSEDDRSVFAASGSMIFWDESVGRQVSLEWKQAKELSFKLPYNMVS